MTSADISEMPCHEEHHVVHRIGWLRAAVLGANDGLVSIASLLVGVAAATTDISVLVMSGLAGLVAGAMSMAAGEYVSVSSQADAERADLEAERAALKAHPDAELRELAGIYQRRGLDRDLAMMVARQLTAHDALGAHARDELGILPDLKANPLQAAGFSALSFIVGGAIPLMAAILASPSLVIPIIVGATLAGLVLLGVSSAEASHASKARSITRVVFWGCVAMALTALAGHFAGAVI